MEEWTKNNNHSIKFKTENFNRIKRKNLKFICYTSENYELKSVILGFIFISGIFKNNPLLIRHKDFPTHTRMHAPKRNKFLNSNKTLCQTHSSYFLCPLKMHSSVNSFKFYFFPIYIFLNLPRHSLIYLFMKEKEHLFCVQQGIRRTEIHMN